MECTETFYRAKKRPSTIQTQEQIWQNDEINGFLSIRFSNPLLNFLINMKSILKPSYFFLLLFLWAFVPFSTYAQQNVDITSIRVDQLSDDQIEELVKRAQDAGLSSTDFLMMAQ